MDDVSCRPARIAFSTVRRQRVLVLNQYYWPGVEATANLLTELCEALAADYDVTVVTGARGRARAAKRGAERRRDRPRPLDLVRPLAAVAPARQLPDLRARRAVAARCSHGGPTSSSA